MREGIISVLALSDEIDLVDSCGNDDELIDAVAAHEPDVVITDIRMPPTQTDEGIRAARTASSWSYSSPSVFCCCSRRRRMKAAEANPPGFDDLVG